MLFSKSGRVLAIASSYMHEEGPRLEGECPPDNIFIKQVENVDVQYVGDVVRA